MKDKPNKITTVLKVVVTGEFYDDDATEETLRYAVEQDLEDAGFDVDVSMLKEQQPKTGHWVAKSNVSWHENGDDDATPVFYATVTCSECGKPYRYEVAHTFVDYDEWALAYVPNEPVLNNRRIPIYNKAFEEHKEKLKSFLYEWISCPYCGAKMEKQP